MLPRSEYYKFRKSFQENVMKESDFERPTDALYRTVPQPFTVDLPVLGIPVHFGTNAADVLATIKDAFGIWEGLNAASVATDPQLTVRILVHDRSEPVAGSQADFVYRLPDDDRTIIHAPGSVAIADPARRDAVAYVSPALVSDTAHFRHGLIEALTWTLLTRFDRQPLHAAALMRGRSALLLYGASGAGKSTLVYAAARQGFQVMTDDVVYIQMNGGLRVWGAPGFLHLAPDVMHYFPELTASPPARHPNGKWKVGVDLRSLKSTEPSVAADCGICIIGKRRDSAAITRLTPADVVSSIDMRSESGFDFFAESIVPALHALAQRGGWLLNPGSDPDEAVLLLDGLLDELGAPRVPA
jgi:hypothetical protein